MNHTHFPLIGLALIFIVVTTTRTDADGSQRSVGLHHWVKGNECYRSEDWACSMSSWSIALSTPEFIKWQEPRNTVNGMYGLAQAAVKRSKNCNAASSLSEIITVGKIISDAAEQLSELGRLTVSSDKILAFITPSLDVCHALICKSNSNDECVEERVMSIDVSRLEEHDFLDLLPSALAKSKAVSELIQPLFDSHN